MSESDLDRPRLRARRDELAEQVARLQFDLGGLAYEMAIRDHLRLDVLVRRAAALQHLDAELGEVERLLALDEPATGGACPSCGALHGRGAVYCWQCGSALVQITPVNGTGASSVPSPASEPKSESVATSDPGRVPGPASVPEPEP